MFKGKSIKEKVANQLLGKWLQDIKLEEGEVNSALVMFSEAGKTILLVTALGVENDKLVIKRVINSVNVNDAL
jgi:hypothetical protein